jgi:hypothetical protein
VAVASTSLRSTYDFVPEIPGQRLRAVQNTTPFAQTTCMKMGPGRRFYDVLVVKATYQLAPGALTLAPSQAAIALADEYWDLEAPERSSVKHAGEMVLFKASTDVIVTGSARAPAGRPCASWYAAVRIESARGRVVDCVAQVTGPRAWQHRPLQGWVLSDPEPTLAVPIRYERAYGGAYLDRARREPTWIVHSPNPSGTGFFDERAMDREASYPAPQWQPPDQPVTKINRALPVTGFGPIMRAWSSRRRYAGTYDEHWLSTMRAEIRLGLPPDYPPDLDLRFFSCAHPALIAPGYLAGDEEIALTGFFDDHGRLSARLPGVSPKAWLQDARGAWSRAPLPLDTVHVDVDRREAYLCWRLPLAHERGIESAVIVTGSDHEHPSHR